MSHSRGRLRTAAIMAGFLLAATGCGNSPIETVATGTVEPPEPATIEQLDFAVRSATQLLLDAPGLEATTLRFGQGGQLEGTDWWDYRSSGDFRALFARLDPSLDGTAATAWVQVGNDLYSAESGPRSNEPWSQQEPAVPTEDEPRMLTEMADGSTLASVADTPASDIEVTRQVTADGGILWSLNNPLDDDTVTREWGIGRDGFLRFYSIRSDSGRLIGGVATAWESEFTPVAHPDAITAPDVGSVLDLDGLDLPADLSLPE